LERTWKEEVVGMERERERERDRMCLFCRHSRPRSLFGNIDVFYVQLGTSVP